VPCAAERVYRKVEKLMRDFNQSLEAKIHRLEVELERKTKLLVKVVEELYGSPHKYVKDLRNEVISELSTPKQN